MRRLTMLGVILSMGLIALLIVALPASANHLPGGAPLRDRRRYRLSLSHWVRPTGATDFGSSSG